MSGEIEQTNNSSGGFTLAETLLAVLILLMVSTIVANGIPAAKNAYEKVVLTSNAEVLLSTTISTLQYELGTAQDIETSGNTITYYNPSRGALAQIYVDADKGIMLKRYYFPEGYGVEEGVAPDAEQLIPSKTATADLYITFSGVGYSNGIITFSNLSVNRASGREGIASRNPLSIRVISS